MLRIRRYVVVASVATVLGVLGTVTPACGTDPVGVESCQKIQKVRCESAAACGVSLGRPVHSGTSAKSDVAACTRYYDDECQHGLALAKDPGAQAVDLCVTAIVNGDCSIVTAPETHAACAFLSSADAGTGADADANEQ